jgi:hypothetical protein
MILDENFIFDQAKYEAYSPLFLSTTFALCYGISFAAVTSVVVHTYLYHGTEIVQRYKMACNQEDDVHMRLMKKYRDAPDWWYLAMFLIMVGKLLRVGLTKVTYLSLGCSVVRNNSCLGYQLPLVVIDCLPRHPSVLDGSHRHGSGND